MISLEKIRAHMLARDLGLPIGQEAERSRLLELADDVPDLMALIDRIAKLYSELQDAINGKPESAQALAYEFHVLMTSLAKGVIK